MVFTREKQPMHVKRFGLLTALGLGLGAGVAASQDLGLWDAVSAIGPGEYAVERADEMATVAQQLARGFIMDDASSELVQTLYRDLLSLHLGRLYEMLPVYDGQSRWLGLEGLPTEAGYALTLHAVAPERDSSKLGDLAGWLEMSPFEGSFGSGQPFAVNQRLEIGTGATGPGDLIAFVTGMMVALEREINTPQPTELMAVAQAAEPGLSVGERPLLAAIYKAAPHAADALADVVVLRSLGRNVSCGDKPCLAYDVDMKLDVVGLKRLGYPHLAETIRKWENLAQVQIRVQTQDGADLISLAIRTDPAGIRVRFVSKDGKVVPIRQGKPMPGAAISLSDVNEPIAIAVRADLRYEGFTLAVRDLRFPGRLKGGNTEASFVGRIDHTPSLVMSGTDAFRSTLASFADSTLGLGDHGRDFARYVAIGRDGKGTPVGISMDKTGGDGHVLTQTVDTVLLDNALIRFAFRIVGGRLIPDKAAITEFGTLVETVINALVVDYQAARPALAVRG
jgi:hypothetical protein